MSDDILNIQEALERVQDDKELLLELFDIFEEDFEEKRKSIDSAISEKNFETLKNIAHSMKGASSNISAKRIFESLAHLEQIAPEGDSSEIGQTLTAIDVQYTELKSRLVKLRDELR